MQASLHTSTTPPLQSTGDLPTTVPLPTCLWPLDTPRPSPTSSLCLQCFPEAEKRLCLIDHKGHCGWVSPCKAKPGHALGRAEAGKLGVHSRPELDHKTPVGVERRGQGQASFEELMPLEAAPVYVSSCSYMLASLPHMCATHVGT